MKKNVKKLGALLLAGAMAVSTVGCMPTSKPQESTGNRMRRPVTRHRERKNLQHRKDLRLILRLLLH
jgi:hypothetical protein